MKRLLICATVLLFSAVQAWAADGFVGQGGQQPSAAVDPSKPTYPLKPIYFVSGIADTFGWPYGDVILTSYFHCSNLGSSAERIRVIVRDQTGAIKGNRTVFIGSNRTLSFATTIPALSRRVFNAINLGTGSVNQGLGMVFATSPLIICSAVTVGMGTGGGAATALHMVRVNPNPSWAE